MAGVGGVTCNFVKGTARGLAQRVLSWFVPGIGGQAALRLGFSEGEFRFACVVYGSAADVVAWRLSLEALQGEVVSVVDDWGVTHTNCLVTKVGELARTPATGTGDPAVTCRGELVVEGLVVA